MTAYYPRPIMVTAWAALGIAVMASAPARADVTIQQQMTMNLVSIKISSTTMERTVSDKQRKDIETRCGGFMSLLCGDAKSGEIVRLDRQVDWQLQPKKKLYQETQFPTAEQRALAQQKLQETLDKMKQCVPQQQSASPAADTSGCDLSAPVIDVKQTDEHATLAGHDSRKSSVVITQTCTDRKTGDICELNYGFDVWLTQDEIAGIADRQAFLHAYMKAQGLDENNPDIKGAVQQFMSQYASTMKQLADKASSLKGYPLRTTFSLSIGGEHCSRAKQATPSAANNSGSHGIGFGRIAGEAIGGKLSGLFARKGLGTSASADAGQASADAVAGAVGGSGSSSASPASPASSASPGGNSTSQSVQLVSFTTETTAIDTSPISADQFEIPAGWMRVEPKAAKNNEFTCPANGK